MTPTTFLFVLPQLTIGNRNHDHSSRVYTQPSDVPNTFIAYVITHLASGAMYVGSSSDGYKRIGSNISRLNYGTHHVKRLQDLYNQNSSIKIEYWAVESRDEAYALEQQLYDQNKYTGLLLNSTGEDVRVPSKGVPMSQQQKETLSRLNSGKTLPEETRRKMSEAQTGRVVSEETRLKISEGRTGILQTVEAKQKMSEGRKALFNTPEGEALKLKMSEDKKTLYVGPDGEANRMKMSDMKKAFYNTPEGIAVKLKLSQSSSRINSKPIEISGVRYDSTKEAAIVLGITESKIQHRLNSNTGKFDDYKRL